MTIYYLYISLLFFTVLAGWESRIHIKEGSVTWPQVGAGCRLGASVPLYVSPQENFNVSWHGGCHPHS